MRWLFAPACQGKGNHETWRALAMPFSPCRSRKRQSWDLACACDGLFPLPVEEKSIMGLVVRLRWPFLPACRGKGLYRSKINMSWKPFASPKGEKGNFETDYMPKRIMCRQRLCVKACCVPKKTHGSKQKEHSTDREREREREERRKREIEKDERESERTQDGEG